MEVPIVNNDIFKIGTVAHNDGAINVMLGIDKNSALFKGHFPGQPIVPGACMLQVVKDVLEIALGTPILLKKAVQIKFLSMIDPTKISEVHLTINYKIPEDGIVQIAATLAAAETVYFKMQAVYVNG